MTARPGHVLRWMRAVSDIARGDASDGRPTVQAIEGVAYHRVLHADADGTNCYPARATLAQRVGRKPATVTRVDEWLELHGLLERVRTLPWNVTEYALTIPPVGDGEAELDGDAEVELPDSVGDAGAQLPDTVGDGEAELETPVMPPVGDGEAHNLQPLLEEEEEEARPAAPAGPSDEASALVDFAAKNCAHALDLAQLATPIQALLDRGWSPPAIKEQLLHTIAKCDGRNATKFITTGLRRADQPALPAWVRVINDLRQLALLEAQFDLSDDALEALSRRRGQARLERAIYSWPTDDPRHNLGWRDAIEAHDPSRQIELADQAECQVADLIVGIEDGKFVTTTEADVPDYERTETVPEPAGPCDRCEGRGWDNTTTEVRPCPCPAGRQHDHQVA